jgi:hypothetical protein
VTRIHKLAVQHAALLAGDAAAIEIRDVCAAAGVTILRYPVGALSMKAGETLALGAITDGLKSYGREVLTAALFCVTETSNNRPNLLAAQIIKALCAVLAGNPKWRAAGERLLQAFDAIDLEVELDEARVTRRPKGMAVWEVLADRIREALTEALGPGQ